MTRFCWTSRGSGRFTGSLPRTADARVEAFDEVYRRHADAAWGVAYAIVRNTHDASDAVNEGFANAFRSMPEGDDVAVRPYVLAAVRHAAIDVLRRSQRVEPREDVGEPVGAGTRVHQPADPVVASEDAEIVVKVFTELPERWRSALWLIEVEELSTTEAGTVLGVSPNNAAQLATRARSRLRQEYLQAHVPNHIRPDCTAIVSALGSYAAGTAPARRRARIDAHLAGCADCRARLAELDDLGLTLRRALPPLPLALQWGREHRRGSFAALLDSVRAGHTPLPTGRTFELAAGVVPQLAAASPIIERVVAVASAAVLVVGMSALAVRVADAPPPTASPAPAAETAAPAPGPAAGGLPGPAPPTGAGSPIGPAVPAAVAPGLPRPSPSTGGAPDRSLPAALSPGLPVVPVVPVLSGAAKPSDAAPGLAPETVPALLGTVLTPAGPGLTAPLGGGTLPAVDLPGDTLGSSLLPPLDLPPSSPGPGLDVSTPPLSAPALSTPSLSTPSLSTPSVSTPSVSTPSVSTPSLSTPSLSTPSLGLPPPTLDLPSPAPVLGLLDAPLPVPTSTPLAVDSVPVAGPTLAPVTAGQSVPLVSSVASDVLPALPTALPTFLSATGLPVAGLAPTGGLPVAVPAAGLPAVVPAVVPAAVPAALSTARPTALPTPLDTALPQSLPLTDGPLGLPAAGPALVNPSAGLSNLLSSPPSNPFTPLQALPGLPPIGLR